MKIVNCKEAAKYLMSLRNIPRKEYLKDKKDAEIYLKRLGYFLKLLGNPENKIQHYIHIAGTSGKGSTAIMMESILRAAGKKTGLTTSPHPSAITERWEVNGRKIRDKNFASLVMAAKPKLDEYKKCSPYDFLSFFEIITALGLWHFAKQRVEWAVIEAGLGGRYDSTNIIPRKDMAIITNIGRDHLNLIGPTLADAAREKAGIIKPNCKVLTMEKNPRFLNIIKNECKKQNANIKILNIKKNNIQHSIFNILSGTKFNYKNTTYRLPVVGLHQISNAVLAIEAARWIGIDEKYIKAGLNKIKLPLRMEIISQKPLVILDGAHNIDKMETTVNTMKEILNREKKTKKLHLVIGFSADKDIRAMLKQLASLKPKSAACAQSTCNPLRQPADPNLLQKKLKKILPQTEIKSFMDLKKAFFWAKQKTKRDDILLVTGSFFLSGEIRSYLTHRQK